MRAVLNGGDICGIDGGYRLTPVRLSDGGGGIDSQPMLPASLRKDGLTVGGDFGSKSF